MKRLAVAAALALALPAVALADELPARCAAEAPLGRFAACEQALARSPDDLALRRLLALGMLLGGAEKDAILAYRHLAELMPEDAVAHFQLAVAFGTVRDFRQAVAPLARTLALNPAHRDAIRLAAIVHQQLGQFDEVIAHLRRLAETGDEVGMYDLAVANERGAGTKADPAEALHWFVKAAEAGHVAALDRLAEAHFEGHFGLRQDNQRGNDYATRARDARRGVAPR